MNSARVEKAMRFSCESCGAQYMISDEKVGPQGVRVRCKKCSEVIRIRRAAGSDQAPSVAAPPAPPADPEVTSDWYVAIDDRQVGPLHRAALRTRWEAGEIGPDTLAWRTGMADWSPLSAIPDLADRLAARKVEASAAGACAEHGGADAADSSLPSDGAASAAAHGAANGLAPPGSEAVPDDIQNGASSGLPNGAGLNGRLNGKVMTWQPSAGTALASLASQELKATESHATPAAGEPGPAANPPRSGASLLDQLQLPEGGVDPTHLIPLPMKGLDRTTEVAFPPRTAPESEPTQIRQLRTSAKRSGIAWGMGVASVAAIVFAAGFWLLQQSHRSVTAPVARAPIEARTAPVPAPPTPVETAQSVAKAPPPAAVASPVEVKSEPPAPVVEPQPSPEPVASAPAQIEKPVPPRKHVSRAEPVPVRPKPAPLARPAAVERLAKPAPAPQVERPSVSPAPALVAAPKKNGGDPLLDVGGDDELEKELASTKPKRNVYVPPAIGSDLPENVSVSQINEAVVGQKAALLRCIEEQRSVDSSARGTLKLRWIIGADGSSRDVRVASEEYAKQPIAPCLSNVVKGIRFPRSKSSGQEVVFPFKF